MAAVKASETRTCHTCGVVSHIARNCPTTNPNAAAVQQRLRRWDPRNSCNKAGSFSPAAYGHCSGYRGGPVGGTNGCPVGGMNGGPAGGMNCGPVGGNVGNSGGNATTYGSGGAGAGRNGYCTPNFGRCIPSRPLQQVVPQASHQRSTCEPTIS
eukprot:1274276-Rhodomonas_salina.1